MLTIRQAQLDALSQARMARFEDRLHTLLSTLAPGLSASEISAVSTRILRDAPTFGLHSEADIARFGEISLAAFDPFPQERLPVPALAILMSHGLAPQRKLERYAAWAASAGEASRRTGGAVQ
ncbi:hypothetical protein [Pseudomonas sp. zfem002]|uniref:hypothetical protein n=1 Tax=Pseudomonas sp. zfem002 TaxID=3078197 RepID=UPI002928F4C8|nr:hypothetical protein [Pseudomonas sp. zfem002]MDU9394342.1 hypothetical protein [Pseudomonas sp. zfem002]